MFGVEAKNNTTKDFITLFNSYTSIRTIKEYLKQIPQVEKSPEKDIAFACSPYNYVCLNMGIKELYSHYKLLGVIWKDLL